MNTKSISSIDSLASYRVDAIKSIDVTNPNNGVTRKGKVNFWEAEEDDSKLECPYSYLDKGDHTIEYNGVVFQCDYEHNAITLGNVNGDPKKVLTISLPSGGRLIMNVDNIGDISKAASMFTPEDLNAIIHAIKVYEHCTKKKDEVEEEKNNVLDDLKERMEQNSTYQNERYQKLMNQESGETEHEVNNSLMSEGAFEKPDEEELERWARKLLEDRNEKEGQA